MESRVPSIKSHPKTQAKTLIWGHYRKCVRAMVGSYALCVMGMDLLSRTFENMMDLALDSIACARTRSSYASFDRLFSITARSHREILTPRH